MLRVDGILKHDEPIPVQSLECREEILATKLLSL